MNYQPSENETWVQTLLFIVYQPMVAQKTGQYSLSQIINQFPSTDRQKIKVGIDALVEMSVFVKDGANICITEKSESLFHGIAHLAGQPIDAVQQILRDHPAFSSMLVAINNDPRFAPPVEVMSAASHSKVINASESLEGKPVSTGAAIFYSLFGILVLFGFINAIVKRFF